jgi:hypothetical protein
MSRHHKRSSAKHILRDIGKGFQSVAHPIEHIVKDTAELPSKALDRAGDITQELALPALVIGGLILFAYLNSQR